MITFLPYKSMVKSAEVLDNERLGQQRYDAAKILEILTQRQIIPGRQRPLRGFDYTLKMWERHPAVQMWTGHEEWLKLYLACVIGEWKYRGYSNTLDVPVYDAHSQSPPAWLGYEEFHKSHRSNLIRRAPGLYAKYWPEEDRDLLYFWPTLNGFDITHKEAA